MAGGSDTAQKMMWRVSIDMKGSIKRPYKPSIEVATRPGEELAKGSGRRAPDRLALVLRSYSKFYYGLLGLRLPPGVDRKKITCEWDEDEQAAVLKAPIDTTAPSTGVMTGVRGSFGGNLMTSCTPNRSTNPYMYTMLFDSKSAEFASGSVSNKDQMLRILFGDASDVNWDFNNLKVIDVVLEYEVVAVEEKEGGDVQSNKKEKEYPPDFFDGDGGYEKQYWFRNPVIKLSHYDEEKPSGSGFHPNPYATDPFA